MLYVHRKATVYVPLINLNEEHNPVINSKVLTTFQEADKINLKSIISIWAFSLSRWTADGFILSDALLHQMTLIIGGDSIKILVNFHKKDQNIEIEHFKLWLLHMWEWESVQDWTFYKCTNERNNTKVKSCSKETGMDVFKVHCRQYELICNKSSQQLL